MTIAMLVPIIGIPVLFMSGDRILYQRPLARAAIVFIACASPLILKPPLLSWLLIGTLALILRALIAFSDRRGRFDLGKDLPRILDGIVISMKSGSPLRTSVRASARELSPNGARRVLEIVDRIDLSVGADDGFSLQERDFLRRLRAIDAASARAIERIENWRRTVRVQTEFHRRAAQVTLQIRAQAAICAALFLPAMLWNFTTPNTTAFWRAGLATILFTTAQFWIHRSFRRWKWTI